MYALQDYIGEDGRQPGAARVSRRDGLQGAAVHRTRRQFLGYLRAVTPPEYQYLIDDLFETITLYDNRAVERGRGRRRRTDATR